MTDNDIIKALNCCSNDDCKHCSRRYMSVRCISKTAADALDLINRQKAEIERLRHTNADICEVGGKLLRERKTIRAEAIKEFAERLKKNPIDIPLPILGLETKDEIIMYVNNIFEKVDDIIDNLVKEFTEETT